MVVGRRIARMLLRRYDVRVVGTDLVPKDGPVILASNHIGYLDGPLLFGVSPRPVHALVKDSMFRGRTGRMLTAMGQISVDRTVADARAVKLCLKVLSQRRALAIYPEGNRGLGDVSITKGGAAYFALVTGAPVVPVACLGTRTHGAHPNSMPERGTRVDTVFGEPMRFDPVPWPRTKQTVAEVQAEIQARLATHVKAACEVTGQRLPGLPGQLASGY